jgi:cobalt-zinc-cadmium efflux system membrane fusion protein
MWVRERPIAREVVAAAWVESPGTIAANLYRDELALLEGNAEGTFVRSGAAESAIRVRLGADATAWDAETVRVRLHAPAGAAPIGAMGWVRFASRTRKMLAVPLSAVLQSPSGAYVLVASVDRRTFTKRPIEIGRFLYGYAPVLSGLANGERIAVMETFFLDAERRLRAQSGGPAATGPP